MILSKLYSYLLVSIQLFLIFLIALHASFRNTGILPLLIFIAGIILGFWAIFVMQKSKLRITPDVAKNAILVKEGPYKYVRHPMYSSVLTMCLGMVLTNIYYLTAFFYVLLFIVLFLKINYEEKLLKKHFSDYKIYKTKTKRLIPFLY